MTRELDLDPEVLADLELRDASMRDRSRSRRAEATLGRELPAPPVAWWTCRAPRCGQLVGIPEQAVERLEIFNARLVSRGEQPIPDDTVAVCDEHRAMLLTHRAETLRRKHDRLRENIVKLKASPNPRSEHELLRELERDHHPDISGLLESLARKLEGDKASKRTRRGDL